MTITMTIISDAKCKHCAWLKQISKRGKVRHKCTNPKSERCDLLVPKNMLVCGVWEMFEKLNAIIEAK